MTIKFTVFRPTMTAFNESRNEIKEKGWGSPSEYTSPLSALKVTELKASYAEELNDAVIAHKAQFDLCLEKGLVVPMATVECHKDEIFENTNSINTNWVDNEKVQLINPSVETFNHSTKAGDILFAERNGKKTWLLVAEYDFVIIK